MPLKVTLHPDDIGNCPICKIWSALHTAEDGSVSCRLCTLKRMHDGSVVPDKDYKSGKKKLDKVKD